MAAGLAGTQVHNLLPLSILAMSLIPSRGREVVWLGSKKGPTAGCKCLAGLLQNFGLLMVWCSDLAAPGIFGTCEKTLKFSDFVENSPPPLLIINQIPTWEATEN